MTVKRPAEGAKIVLYECGICGGLHPWTWDGDCREDANRYGSVEEYAERNKPTDLDIEIRPMHDRIAAVEENRP